MGKCIIWIIACLMLIVPASAVIVNTNLTLRAACVDSTGNLCLDSAGWTIISPNGTTLYNNTQGENTHYGINNFTIWLNLTGNYFVLANFSVQNVTREYNILVEDYETTNTNNLWEENQMLTFAVIIGTILFILAFLIVKLDQEHFILKVLLLAFFIGFLIMLPMGALKLSSDADHQAVYKTATTISAILGSLIGIYIMFYLWWVSTKKVSEMAKKKIGKS